MLPIVRCYELSGVTNCLVTELRHQKLIMTSSENFLYAFLELHDKNGIVEQYLRLLFGSKYFLRQKMKIVRRFLSCRLRPQIFGKHTAANKILCAICLRAKNFLFLYSKSIDNAKPETKHCFKNLCLEMNYFDVSKNFD